MQRLFVTLFLIVSLTLIVVGWGVEQLWPVDEAPVEQYRWQKVLLANLADQMPASGTVDEDVVRPWLARESERLAIELALVPKAVVAWLPAQQQQLASNESVLLFDPNDNWTLYQPLDDSEWLLRLSGSNNLPASQWPEYLPWLISYCLLALALWIWLWPLWRDLKLLKRALAHFKEHNQSPDIAISSRSALAPIFNTFEQMVNRIHRLMAAQRDLSNAVSHELRTPLARLKFALAMLEGADRRQVEEMQRDVAELEALSNEMLRFSQMQSQAPELSLEQVDLAQLVNNKIQQLQQDDTAGLKWRLEGQLTALCDGHFIERALQNLLTNARRYGRRQVVVRLRRAQGQNRIIVDDDGPGIDEQHWQSVFQPFVRLERNEQGGHGFGLAIVRQIMGWHGGDCRVGRSPEGGARFELYWS